MEILPQYLMIDGRSRGEWLNPGLDEIYKQLRKPVAFSMAPRVKPRMNCPMRFATQQGGQKEFDRMG